MEVYDDKAVVVFAPAQQKVVKPICHRTNCSHEGLAGWSSVSSVSLWGHNSCCLCSCSPAETLLAADVYGDARDDVFAPLVRWLLREMLRFCLSIHMVSLISSTVSWLGPHPFVWSLVRVINRSSLIPKASASGKIIIEATIPEIMETDLYRKHWYNRNICQMCIHIHHWLNVYCRSRVAKLISKAARKKGKYFHQFEGRDFTTYYLWHTKISSIRVWISLVEKRWIKI